LFLLDENVPVSLVKFLKDSGLEVRRVSEIKRGAGDQEVVRFAKELGAVVVTLDSDFTRLCFLGNIPVILIKVHPRIPGKIVRSVRTFLKTFRKHRSGLLIIYESSAVKRRR